MNKLFSAIAILSVATLLAGGGFTGYLFGSGKLNAQRMETIAQVLRGELDDAAGEGEQVPESQPATGEGEGDEAGARTGGSAAEARARQKREELESLRLERAKDDLAAQRRMLEQIRLNLVQEQEQFAEAQAAFVQQEDNRAAKLRDDGFQKELALVASLKPAQAKAYIERVWQSQKADAVRLMAALEERQAKRILDQFKTPEELTIMTDLLEQIRLQGTEGDASVSRTTDGDAAP